MFALADKVSRAARLLLAGPPESALWTVSAAGHIVGSLVCEAGAWRLSWFDGADRRLASYAGPVDGDDLDALARALSLRLGRQVELQSLPV